MHARCPRLQDEPGLLALLARQVRHDARRGVRRAAFAADPAQLQQRGEPTDKGGVRHAHGQTLRTDTHYLEDTQ
eukprot:5348321-Pleurochrysis_carterae.AAC.2